MICSRSTRLTFTSLNGLLLRNPFRSRYCSAARNSAGAKPASTVLWHLRDKIGSQRRLSGIAQMDTITAENAIRIGAEIGVDHSLIVARDGDSQDQAKIMLRCGAHYVTGAHTGEGCI